MQKELRKYYRTQLNKDKNRAKNGAVFIMP
nr:MAG TPA: hypothetical protein [Caudoviricetes sp.]